MNNPPICLKLHYSCCSALQHLKDKAPRASEIHKTCFPGSTLDNLVTHSLISGYLQAKRLTYIRAMLQRYLYGLTRRKTSCMCLSSSLITPLHPSVLYQSPPFNVDLMNLSLCQFHIIHSIPWQHPTVRHVFLYTAQVQMRRWDKLFHFHRMEIYLNCSL